MTQLDMTGPYEVFVSLPRTTVHLVWKTLDPVATERIEELLTELKREYTLVMVTHNIQQAARVADRTIFLLLGELVEEGSTSEMFTTPKDSRTESFISGRFG